MKKRVPRSSTSDSVCSLVARLLAAWVQKRHRVSGAFLREESNGSYETRVW